MFRGGDRIRGHTGDLDRANTGQPRDPGGVSGDPFAATGLIAGCDLWYSVLAGVLPVPCLVLTRAAQSGDTATAAALSGRLAPLWSVFRSHGSLRTVSVIAEILGLVRTPNLPAPVRGLPADAREAVAAALETLRDRT